MFGQLRKHGHGLTFFGLFEEEKKETIDLK